MTKRGCNQDGAFITSSLFDLKTFFLSIFDKSDKVTSFYLFSRDCRVGPLGLLAMTGARLM
jgi:hypothetical protein